MSTLPLGDFERDQIIVSWHAGFMSAEACRAWLRAPSATLLDDENVQREYRKGLDHQGEPLKDYVKGLVQFCGRFKLGQVAVLQMPYANYIVIRPSKYRTWLALVEDWGQGLTVYSRWSAEGTVNYDMALDEETLSTLILYAQKSSAQRPVKPRASEINPSGADFIDPAQPRIGTVGTERNLQPDIVDRVMAWMRDFF